MSKKFVSILLVLAMAATMAVSAMATPVNGSTSVQGGTPVNGGTAVVGGTVDNNTSDYTLTIPAGNTEMDLTQWKANGIGVLAVRLNEGETKTFDPNKEVYIYTESNHVDGGGYSRMINIDTKEPNYIQYMIDTDGNDGQDQTMSRDFKQTFSAADVNNGTSVELFVKSIVPLEDVVDGKYRDAIRFIAKVLDAQKPVD